MEWIINQRVISYGQWAISLQRHNTVLLQFRHSIQLSSHSFNHSTIELHVIEQIRSPGDSRVIHRHSTLYRRWRTSAGAGGRWEWAAMVWVPHYTNDWHVIHRVRWVSLCVFDEEEKRMHNQAHGVVVAITNEWMLYLLEYVCVCVGKYLSKVNWKKKGKLTYVCVPSGNQNMFH